MAASNRALSVRKFVFSAAIALLLCPVLPAQKGASRLEGTVKDQSGGVIVGASVTARNEETNVGREVFTADTGIYVFAALPAGYYTVTVELPGFKKSAVEHLKLDVAAVQVQNFALEVGQLTEVVSVTAAGVAPIQTTSSEIADTVQGSTIQQLPLNGRNALELIALNAGIPGNQAMSQKGSAVDETQNQAGLGANGARAVNNAVYLDGVDITNSERGTGGGIATGTDIAQSVDAIGEFRVISANPTAEFGKSSGMQIEIVTRSGTNNFHGSLYEFHRNTIFNSNSFFNNALPAPAGPVPRPKLIRNQFGFTLGGPVTIPWLYSGKNRTFFFINYEGFRERRGASALRTVFTEESRNGVFRYNTSGPNATSLVDSATGKVRAEYADRIANMDVPALDKTRWDGIGKDTSGLIDRYLKLMPLPNYFGDPGSGRDGLNLASYRFNAPDPDDRDNVVVKVDQTLGTRHSFTVRYSHGSQTQLADLEPFPGLPARNREESQRGVSLNLISNLTRTVTNEFRFGFSRNRREFTSNLEPGAIVIDCASTFECTGATNPDLTGEASVTARMTYQFTDNVSWAHNNHLFKGGLTVRTTPLNLRRVNSQLNMDFDSEPRNQQNATVDLGQLFGTASIPINSADRIPAANFFNFYLGRVGGAFATVNAADMQTWGPLGSARVRGFRQREWGVFFQDDWRVSRNWTWNLGLRYELFEVPYEVNSFYTTPINRNILDPEIDTTLVAPPIEFGAIGPRNGISIYPGDHNNFAPVIGFSYDPTGKGKTAIRLAYRISYDKIFTSTLDTIDGNAPGLQLASTMNGDTLRNTGLFVKLAPGGLNGGQPMTPRLADLKGPAVGGIMLNGPFDFAKYLTTIRSAGGNLPDAPLGKITETRTSDSPYGFTRDFITAYGQTWSLSFQHEIMRGTVIEARYIGRRGLHEYMGLPGNEFRSTDAFKSEFRQLQYLITGGALGIAPANLPAGFKEGTPVTVAQLFGTTPTNASNYSQFVKGALDAYAFQTFPNMYPFFLAGTNSFDNSVASALGRNDYVTTISTSDNSTAYHSDVFLTSVPANAVPSGKGLNPLPPDRQPAADPRGRFGGLPIIVGIQENLFRPNPQFLNGPRVTSNAGQSNYHALQLQVQRRFYEGLQFQVNYTWSKNLDVTNVSQPTGQDAVSFYCVMCDYSYSDNDLVHNFKSNFIWDVPLGKSRRWMSSIGPVLDHVIGGWQLAGNLEAASAFPLNVALNGNDRTAPPTTGGIRPSWKEGVTISADTRLGSIQRTDSGVYYFRPSDFTPLLARALLGTLGNVPRNFWRGPGYTNFDLTVLKEFRITEETALDFRAEFFNLLNHTHFANPDLNAPRGPYVDLANPDAGKIISTIGNPRLMQFALKFRF